MKLQFIDDLKDVKNNCLNSDLWQSLKKDEFIGISITYIFANYEKITRILNCLHCDDIHLNESNIAVYFEDLFKEYKIENILKVYMTDRGANIMKAIKTDLKEEHYSCGCHVLQGDIVKSLNFLLKWEKDI